MQALPGGDMHILLVHIHVKAEFLEEFKLMTLDNAQNSVQEAGVVRFDVLQQPEDVTKFALIEVYRSPEDHQKHRETAHYLRWRDGVAVMMAVPRIGTKFVNLFPGDNDW
jgi:autoinducer 2-degrading protein